MPPGEREENEALHVAGQKLNMWQFHNAKTLERFSSPCKMELKQTNQKKKKEKVFLLSALGEGEKVFRNLIPCIGDSDIPSLEINIKFMLERWNLWEKLAELNVKHFIGALCKPRCISFLHINNQMKMKLWLKYYMLPKEIIHHKGE